ncbi:glycosyltransferase family 39 protein [Candidatus Daviesbacteria bacterium]|nr:glycosyltransferase family 39 protein [Candidatus Daviesbacteria bacterium]
MVNFLYQNRLAIALIILISAVYFLLRLPSLTLQPIFADEAIYIRWAQVMRAEPTLRFLPLSDGKTPLFMWSMIPLFKLFSDPLFAGRFLSIISGFLTLVGVYILGGRFFNRQVGLLAAFLVAVTPLMVFFDRMALVDSMLTAFTIWSLIFSLLLAKYLRLDLSMFLGFIVGGAILTKTPGFFNILTLPLTLISFDWARRRKDKWAFVKLVGFWAVVIIIALIMYNILRLGPGFTSLSSRNGDYVHPPERIFQYPLDPLIPHGKDFLEVARLMITWPIFVLMFASLIWAVVKKHRLALTIAFWALAPLVIQLEFLKTFTARYILFSIPPLLVLTAWFVDYILGRVKTRRRMAWMGVLIFISAVALVFDYTLLTKPAAAPLPKNEHIGYFEDWTAGYGFVQIAQYLTKQSQREDVVVGTDGYFGTLPDGLQIYLDKERHVIVQPGQLSIINSLRQTAREHPTYFVVNRPKAQLMEQNLKLVLEFPKDSTFSHENNSVQLYQVFSTSSASAIIK